MGIKMHSWVKTFWKVNSHYQQRTHLGTGHASKTDDFLENFQMALDPPHPLIFRNLSCNFFSENARKKLYIKV